MQTSFQSYLNPSSRRAPHWVRWPRRLLHRRPTRLMSARRHWPLRFPYRRSPQITSAINWPSSALPTSALKWKWKLFQKVSELLFLTTSLNVQGRTFNKAASARSHTRRLWGAGGPIGMSSRWDFFFLPLLMLYISLHLGLSQFFSPYPPSRWHLREAGVLFSSGVKKGQLADSPVILSGLFSK